jgi:hypothetical protein
VSNRPRLHGKREQPRRAILSPFQIGGLLLVLVAYGLYWVPGRLGLDGIPPWLRWVLGAVGIVAVLFLFRKRKPG